MPICDGVEACKRLRILEGKRKVPVLLPSKLLARHRNVFMANDCLLSCRSERRLSRVDKTIMPKLRYEWLLEQTVEERYDIRLIYLVPLSQCN